MKNIEGRMYDDGVKDDTHRRGQEEMVAAREVACGKGTSEGASLVGRLFR